VLARQPEQSLAVRFYVVAKEEPLAPFWQDRAQPGLALDQRQVFE
jgi:hypothetical protein